MYKLVAIDLDGTLLNSYGEVSEKNKEAIQKCRKRYKNLHKQVTIGASERVQRLFNQYREQMPKYIEQYKSNLISGEELMEWLECMKIKKK